MTETLFEFVQPQHGPIPKTLILDLDETLVHSYENPSFVDWYHIYSDPAIYRRFHPVGTQQICYSMFLDLKSTGSPHRIWGLTRPHLYDFLHFAGEYFTNIMVWSAGTSPYVNEITQNIFLESGLPPPKVVWHRDHCSKYKDMYHKPIYELVNDIAKRSHSTLKMDPSWTLIVDDKSHTFMENPNSGVLIPAYFPGEMRSNKIPLMEDLLERSDTALLKLKNWLELSEVKSCSDIRDLDKTKIFY